MFNGYFEMLGKLSNTDGLNSTSGEIPSKEL